MKVKRILKVTTRFSDDLLYLIHDDNKARTHQIHILEYDSPQWHNYVDFRDYLNAFPEIAYEYEKLKIDLAIKHTGSRSAYTDGKQEFMKEYLPKAVEYAKKQG